MYPYKVSIIMAVYNVEAFLKIAIDSILQQSIGFEHVQLILVDDGAPDNSGAICDEYKSRYPDNICVIHKENGGVSSARNAGIPYAEGRFVNFMDADDKLDKNTLENVYNFFSEHYEETDIVSFRMTFFDGSSGDHVLNYKYKHGDRVIDLNTDWLNPQLSLSSAFVKREVIQNLRFDTKLCFAEDAQLVQKILFFKATLGVVSDAVYWYRRRSSGAQSAVQSSEMRKDWYTNYLQNFTRKTIEFYLERMQCVPKFIQGTLMYDLQWRIKQPNIPGGVLTESEKEAYLAELNWALGFIEDDVIMAQKNMNLEHKVLALSLKHDEEIKPVLLENDIAFRIGDAARFHLSQSLVKLNFLHISDSVCTIEGIFLQHSNLIEDVSVFARCNGKIYHSEITGIKDPVLGLGNVILYHIGFKIRIPLEDGSRNEITFLCEARGLQIPLNDFLFGSFFPVSQKFVNSHYCIGKDWIVTCLDGGISVEPYRIRRAWALEKALCKELWSSNVVGARNSAMMRVLLHLLKPFKRKPLLLVSDRVMKAGDNGEAFFRYMRENHREMNTFFVISPQSADYETLKKIGPVLKMDSHLHKLCLLLSDCIVSSSGEAEVYNPFFRYHEPYRNLVIDVKFVFLQHGIIMNDLSGWVGRSSKNISGFVTSAKPEYDSIRYGDYEYGEETVWLTGLPRFDRLYRDEQKWITIMPTWRRYLMGTFHQKTDVWSLAPNVENSTYIQFYNALLNNERLLSKAKEYGYKLKFLPHPNFQTHLYLFQKNEEVDYLGREMAYREIYAKSELVVTDYSSAIFDFLYLRKPVVYTHFDREEFYGGRHICSEGYFQYERDAFGEIEYDLEGTVDRIIEYMENGCRMKPLYRNRVENFFAYDDQNNCRRVYEKIMELLNRE